MNSIAPDLPGLTMTICPFAAIPWPEGTGYRYRYKSLLAIHTQGGKDNSLKPEGRISEINRCSRAAAGHTRV